MNCETPVQAQRQRRRRWRRAPRHLAWQRCRCVTAWPGVTPSDTCDDAGDDGDDELAAPTSVASLCTSIPLAVRQSVAGSSCSNTVAIREPTLGPSAHGRHRVLHRSAHPLRALTVAVPMARGAPASATASAALNFASARRTARPLCRSRVSAVTAGDDRCDTLPRSGDAAPERPGVTSPDVRDDYGDRSTALTMIASLCASSRLSSGQPSPARRGRTTACRRQSSLQSMKAGP